MLDLQEAANLARKRLEDRLVAAGSSKSPLPQGAAIIQASASFRTQLLNALRRSGDERKSPSPAPDALLMAFPEKLLGKWHHLSFGPQRQTSDTAQGPSHDLEAWRTWDSLGTEARITNFYSTQPKAILLAHGLSAIEDSVLLLADVGRASRAARALGVPLRVLLADVSWISYNRSLRRFDLSEQEIENGLRACQAHRQRLYEGVGAAPQVHAIVPFQKKGAVSAQKIQSIASRYLALVATLWGPDKVNTAVPLTNSELATIGRPLQTSLPAESPLDLLRSFPDALPALERALSLHLSVVRTIADRFRVLSPDTFSYYFAQYYAQDGYRGSHVKIAPVSERDFDEPYDQLDDSFRLWGEGHDPAVSSAEGKARKKRRLAAVYLPQYFMADWRLLPYSPLSLNALEASGGRVSVVRDRVILLTDCSPDAGPKVETVLRQTRDRAGAAQLNRLVADIISFLQAATIAQGRGAVVAACRRVGGDLDAALREVHPLLQESFAIECDPRTPTDSLWLSWLEGLDRNQPQRYVPCHLLASLPSTEDWTDQRLAAAATTVLTATRVAADLTS